MKEFKGTKGEWKAVDRTTLHACSGWIGGIDIYNNQEQKACGVEPYEFNGVTIEEARANAKLIAAAPELLEACIKMKQWIDWKHEDEANKDLNMNNIKKAISKALD